MGQRSVRTPRREGAKGELAWLPRCLRGPGTAVTYSDGADASQPSGAARHLDGLGRSGVNAMGKLSRRLAHWAP
jgi:hypothetical protein